MKKLLTLIICAALTVTAGAVTLDTAESAAEKNADTSCAELSSVNLGKPGYNLWTGTETPYTFENSPSIGNNNEAEINVDWSAVMLDITDSGNSALKLSGDNPRFTITADFPELASDERPFTLKFDSKTTTTVDMKLLLKPNLSPNWRYVDGKATDCRQSIIYHNLKNYNTGEWVSHTLTIDASGFTANDASLTDYSKITSFWLGFAGAYGETAAWIDNVSIIPNYKVTYDLGEGAGSFEDEFFYGDTYKLKVDTSLITPPEGKVFSHWEHQYGDTLTDTVYPILGEDLYLTAVYVDKAEEEPSKAGAPGYNLWTGTIDPFTFEGSPTIGSSKEYDIYIDWSSVELDTSESDNTSIKLYGDNPRFTITADFPELASDERPFTLKFDSKTTATVDMNLTVKPNISGNWRYVDGKATDCRQSIIYYNLKNFNSGEWGSHSVTVDASGFTANDASLTDYSKITSFWLGFFGGYGETSAYLDNISIIPNYKVTYDLGEGSGTLADEFFYADSYELQADVSAITAPDGMKFSHWVDQDGNVITNTVTPTLGEDIALTAVYAEKGPEAGAPGINLWTGTTEPYTFEGSPTIGSSKEYDIYIDWSSVELDTSESDNTSIKLYGDNPRFTITADFPELASDERPFTLKFDAKTTATVDMKLTVKPNLSGNWRYVDGKATNCLQSIIYYNLKNFNSGEWGSHSVTVDASGFTANDASLTDYSKITSFWLGFFGAYGETSAYLDNISIIPNYKVTYDLGEGSGTLADEFFYADSYKLQADVSAITAPAGKTFSHWIDADGNTVTDTVVPVLGEDIALTAVYKEDKPISYDKYGIRINDNCGIRFFASVNASQKYRAEEYGYIVARDVILSEYLGLDAEDLTFGLSAEDVSTPVGTLYVKGVAYENKDGGDPEIDIEYGTDEDGNSIFTAVCTGIDLDDASQLTEQLVVRPYITVNGVTCYGTPRVKSFYEVASEISTSEAYDTLPQAQKDKIAYILEVCGN